MDKVYSLLTSLVVLYVFWAEPGKSSSPEYEWSCTKPDDEGYRYIPSIIEDQNALTVATVGAEVSIYQLTDFTNDDCYGRVIEIDYCYQFDNTTEGSAVFNWTVLILEETQSCDFEVINAITIESCALYATSCMSVPDQPLKEQCCDTTVVPEFELSMNFIFGVTESAQGNTHGAALLGFHHSQYRVDAIRLNKAGLSLTIGSTVDLRGVPVEHNSGLRMLWFIIGKLTLYYQ